MKTSIKQTAHRLAAALAIATAVATTGAWAATTTYYQVAGTCDASCVFAADGLASDVEITSTPQLAFPSITLDDIPANATQVAQTTDIPNPITLNTPEYPGWSYTWENLPDIVGGKKIHYAVVETEAKVKAYDLEVQYEG